MTKNLPFIFFYCVLLISTIALTIFVMTHPVFSSVQAFWGIWMIGQFWCFLYVGLGLAIPMGLVGLAFGWLQIILITQGQIQPHLGTAGFGQALKTILGKIYSTLTL